MMSIALENTSNRIEGSGFIRGLSCISIFESADQMAGIMPGDQRFPARNKVVEKRDELDSCSSSSIGRNSDLSGRSESDGEDEGEVQSSYKGPLDSLDALEEVLPIRRGISKFYSGKSKSFTSLADASSSSIKELAKPENSYTRKRKNLLATSIILDKNQNDILRSNVGGGISKRLTSSRRSAFNLTGATSSSESLNTSENSNSSSSSPPRRPPLHPQTKPSLNNTASMPQLNFSSRRAFSLTDLHCATSIANDSNSSSVSNRDENKKRH